MPRFASLSIQSFAIICAASIGCASDATRPRDQSEDPSAITVKTLAGNATAELGMGDSVVLRATVTDARGTVLTTGRVGWTVKAGNEAVGLRFLDDRSVLVKTFNPAIAVIQASVGERTTDFLISVVALRSVPLIWSAGGVVRAIPMPPGSLSGKATAINNRGEVVGDYLARGGGARAFVWSEKTGFRDIHPSGRGANSFAKAINDAGDVVGFASFAFAAEQMFVWSETSGTRLIEAEHSAIPFGINDAGQVVGEHISDGPRYRAFLWSASTGFVVLPVLDANSRQGALDINDDGEVVGYDEGVPLLWEPGLDKPRELTSRLDTYDCDPESVYNELPPHECTARATTINEAGQIAGIAKSRAFRRERRGSVVLFSHPEALSSAATGINRNGDVVGSFTTSPSGSPWVREPFIWRQSGAVEKLPRLADKKMIVATGINDRGDVVGYAR